MIRCVSCRSLLLHMVRNKDHFEIACANCGEHLGCYLFAPYQDNELAKRLLKTASLVSLELEV